MEESGKKLSNIAPEVVKKTEEPAFDVAIEIALGHEPTIAEIETIDNPSEQDAQFAEKIARIKDDIQAFLHTVETRFEKGKGYRAKIREALRLMLKAHIEQPDRADTGLPFIIHPLSVAHDALHMMADEKDDAEAQYVCIAALLHDSVEDQARLLALEKKLIALQGGNSKVPEEIERDGAFGGLEWLFDRRVRFLVQSLTSPLKESDDMSPEERNKQYQRYIESIFINQDHAPSVIKWADLKQNALTIGLIRERAELIRHEGDEKFAGKLDGTYRKLRTKYKPVLEAVQKFFQDFSDQHHPLYSERESIIYSINEVLEKEYA
ncbi:MAG: hypothetical protein CMI56_02040 [Parcubacteria group bacterium]|nr:hypothetical protein [Parcubacteria group bacterium]|tara:strand:- start:12543 stop:13508 length:966 start_codon:yes stop_codon:yes gene_type:complete